MRGEAGDINLVWMLWPMEKVKRGQKGGSTTEPWGTPGVGGQEDGRDL